MLLRGPWFPDDMELRRRADGKAYLRGKFHYGKYAVLSDGGRTGKPKKERIAPRAFRYRVEAPDKEIHLLHGHDFGQPLASKLNDTLFLRDTAEALFVEAIITEEMQRVTYVADVLALIAAGLAFGLSPGFRLPPKRAVEKAETIEEEPDDGSIDEEGEPRHGAIIRTVLAALLYELSVVTRPAYKNSEIEARNWQPDENGLLLPEPSDAGLARTLNRWRT